MFFFLFAGDDVKVNDSELYFCVSILMLKKFVLEKFLKI